MTSTYFHIRIVLVCAIWITYTTLVGQSKSIPDKIKIDGEVVTAVITEDDTLYIVDLDDVNVTSKRRFKNREEYLIYLRYRRYANKVYPYAVEAIRIFKELDNVLLTMRKREQKKHIRKLQKELKQQFEDPLKKLTKTQGKILVHMIEKELDRPMYFLIKDLKGGFTARYWNTAGSLYGYRLRAGYVIGDDPIMDIVLDDFDISHKTK